MKGRPEKLERSDRGRRVGGGQSRRKEPEPGPREGSARRCRSTLSQWKHWRVLGRTGKRPVT